MIEMAIMALATCIIAVSYTIVVVIGAIVGKYGRFDDD
jgi:hypothetical protein